MSDDFDASGRGRGRARFQKLASAALNADVTIDQATTIVNDLSGTIRDMDSTMSTFDQTLVRINRDLGEFEDLLSAIARTTVRLNTALDNIDKLLAGPVAIGQAAVSVFEPATKATTAMAANAAGVVGRFLGNKHD
ncbi:WXG100 family type VII secretion target [Tsukamurella soli]|uniref:Uncharacterized protein n=1 Tax=Tsukamurella soli TaxID=644556 RepID=A0ABP8JDJ0_9ACTN